MKIFGSKKKPDYLIIGTAKGGTDALYTFLSAHPDASPAKEKEIRFFNEHYDKGFDWYLKQFPSITEGNHHLVTGEATPVYLDHSPEIPKRVKKHMPDAKIIALLRNPVDRAYSFYQHQIRMGQMDKAAGGIVSFEELIENDLAQPERYPVADALSGALYHLHLSNWMNVFPRGQILLIKSEDYYKSPPDVYKTAIDFLGLAQWNPKSFYPVNQGRKSNTYPRGYEEMKEETRQRLESYFNPHNQELYQLIGRDLNW